MEKLTYKDFKIGQKITCVKLSDSRGIMTEDFYEQHLTVGKTYKIEDVDFHFPEKICVRSDNKKVNMFMLIELFADNKYIRKLKLDKLDKISKK